MYNMPLWQLMENVLCLLLAEVLFQIKTFAKDEVISIKNMELQDRLSPK